jgi:hypothetical protein
MRLLTEFDDLLEEQRLVGRMLMAYGEFEFDVARLIGRFLDGDDDRAGRIFFRVNGAAARIDVADAFLRPYFAKLGLGGQWGNALGPLRHCKNIRNQYAHCTWFREAGRPLCFINMDADAAAPEGVLTVHLYPTDLDLLQRQHSYFEYTADWLFYLDCQVRMRAGQECPDPPVPKSIPAPSLNNLPKTPPPEPATDTTAKAPHEESKGSEV